MSLALTQLQTAIVRANEKFRAFENRRPDGGVIEAFQKYTNQIVPAKVIQDLKVSTRRPVTIPTLSATAVGVETVRSVNPTRDVATSAMVPTTWVTKAAAFQFAESINADNYISADETLAQLFLNAWRSLFFDDSDSLEGDLIDFLETNKYSALPVSKVRGVTTAAGVYELESNDFVIKVPAVMRELKMSGPYQDIANVASLGRQREDATYGRFNTRNVEQFKGDLEYHFSHNLPVTATKDETHFVTQEGSLAILNAIENDARMGRIGDDGFYTVVVDPWFGFEWGVRVSTVATDQSATGGLGQERALTTRIDLAADFSPVKAFSSVATASPIVKFDTVTTP